MSVAPIRQLKNQVSHFEPFEQDFSYTGDVQSLTIHKSGLYKLEVWGASSSAYREQYAGFYGAGGGGGYSAGYKYLRAGTKLDIVVGGKEGYNGGQKSWGRNTSGDWYWGASGGATHIATYNSNYNGLLKSYVDSTTASEYVHIVAGGGGCPSSYYGNGGCGGGTSGTAGTNGFTPHTPSTPGTQNTGYAFGEGEVGITHPGDNNATLIIGSGGGGWYGGGRGLDGSYQSGGAGGSGYIGGVPEITYKGVTYSPSTQTGSGTYEMTNGKAKITRIA